MRILLRTAIAATLVFLPLAGPAQAQDIYRSWTFFTVEDGEFVASQVGVGEAVPDDGDVLAFRYAAPADFNDPHTPRADLDEVGFDAVCGDVEATDGQKRVAVLIDPGVAEDAVDDTAPPAPEAHCAEVGEGANGLQTIQSVADVRTESTSFGPMVCAFDGYPASGCGEVVESGSPADEGTADFQIVGAEAADDTGTDGEAAEDAADGSNVALWIAVAVGLAGLIGGGALAAKRRSNS